MKKREKIQARIEVNESKIKDLEDKNFLLRIEAVQVSDEKQTYSEKIEKIARFENRKKVFEDVLIGKITWEEHYVDEDSGEVIKIIRNEVVRRNDRWYL